VDGSKQGYSRNRSRIGESGPTAEQRGYAQGLAGSIQLGLGYNPYNRSQVTGFGYNNIPSYGVNLNRHSLPGGVVNGLGSPSNNDSPDPLDVDSYYQTHEYWTPNQYGFVALETYLMAADGERPEPPPQADPNTIDDFTYAYNWSTNNSYM
jgi:hypothetical protein